MNAIQMPGRRRVPSKSFSQQKLLRYATELSHFAGFSRSKNRLIGWIRANEKVHSRVERHRSKNRKSVRGRLMACGECADLSQLGDGPADCGR